jgi:hypothetical protein
MPTRGNHEPFKQRLFQGSAHQRACDLGLGTECAAIEEHQPAVHQRKGCHAEHFCRAATQIRNRERFFEIDPPDDVAALACIHPNPGKKEHTGTDRDVEDEELRSLQIEYRAEHALSSKC